MNLFIIGNGFDRAHGLKTSYSDFREYLDCSEEWEFLRELENMYYFSVDELWKDFEKNLSDFNLDSFIDSGLSIELGLESGDVGIEDTLNYYWEEKYGFIVDLQHHLKKWVEQIDIESSLKTSRIKSETDDLFLTFNYTLLLEEIYEVDRHNILHVHGSIDRDTDTDPIIGHGDYKKIEDLRVRASNASNHFYEKETSICRAGANFIERTLKDVNYYRKAPFFDRLNNIENIFIIGHSLGSVDLPYFEKINDIVKSNCIWNIYYHSEKDKEQFQKIIESIGIKRECIKLLKSAEFFN